MRTPKLAVLLATVSALACAYAAQASDPMGQTAQQADCPLAAADYPAQDGPTPSQAAELGQCDAIDLYYGITGPVDFRRARWCAWRGDFLVLMMLYANGEGVARNFAVARKAACDAESAPAEKEIRLQHLASMESGEAGPGARIDFCDDITSGYMMGACASLGERQRQQARLRSIEQATKTWRTEHRAALQTLQTKVEAFVEASLDEVDLTGTDRGALVVGEESARRDSFLNLLQQAEHGALPASSAREAARLDTQLNELWDQLRQTPDGWAGTAKFAGIREGQRKWLAYRDAWVAFGRIRYPAVPGSVWIALLTQERMKALQQHLEDRTASQ